jgi:hypothetical protein
MPIGIAIALATPTISSDPRIALRIPPGVPKNVPVGSVVKKLLFQVPRPCLSR